MELETLTTNQLREQFAVKFGRPATSRNRVYLVRKLNGTTKASAPPKASASTETAQSIARRLTKDGKSQREVCAALAAGGFKTARGSKTWWPSSVQSLLRGRG